MFSRGSGRLASLTTDVKKDEITELLDKFNFVLFDDRVNGKVKIDNVRRDYFDLSRNI